MIEYQIFNSLRENYHDIRIHILRNAGQHAHLHRALEFLYVMEGEITYTLNNQSIRLQKGSMALALSNQIHSFRADEYAKLFVYVFSCDLVENFTKILGSRTGSTPEFTVNRQTKNFILSNYILPLCAKAAPLEQPDSGSDLVHWLIVDPQHSCTRPIPPDATSEISMLPFLYAICDGYLSSVKLVDSQLKTDNIVHKLLIYISEHFTENITLNSVAAALGYEPHYVSRCFNNFIGIGFKQFLNNYRVDFAKKLLMDPTVSITAAAYTSGFQSIRSFNRIFQETLGMTPTEFRNNADI